MNEYYLLTFESVTQAMEAEALLSGCGGGIVSVPTEINRGCGFAVRLPEPLPEYISVNCTGYYRVTGRGKHRQIERISS